VNEQRKAKDRTRWTELAVCELLLLYLISSDNWQHSMHPE